MKERINCLHDRDYSYRKELTPLGATLKGKNLLPPWKQILSFKSSPRSGNDTREYVS